MNLLFSSASPPTPSKFGFRSAVEELIKVVFAIFRFMYLQIINDHRTICLQEVADLFPLPVDISIQCGKVETNIEKQPEPWPIPSEFLSQLNNCKAKKWFCETPSVLLLSSLDIDFFVFIKEEVNYLNSDLKRHNMRKVHQSVGLLQRWFHLISIDSY